jgi:hypothetical protein
MDVPYINSRLIGTPINWAIVGVTATLWLLLFHFLMTGFTSMKAGPGNKQAPGQSPAGPAPPIGGYAGSFPTS